MHGLRNQNCTVRRAIPGYFCTNTTNLIMEFTTIAVLSLRLLCRLHFKNINLDGLIKISLDISGLEYTALGRVPVYETEFSQLEYIIQTQQGQI